MLNQIKTFSVNPDTLDDFKNALVAAKAVADADPGFVEMRLFTGIDEPTSVYVYERLTDNTALQRHTGSAEAKAVQALTGTALQGPHSALVLSETVPAPDHSKLPDPDDDVCFVFFIFKVKESHHDKVIKRFETHVELTRAEPGNLFLDLYTVDGDRGTLAVYEQFRQQSDLDEVHFSLDFAKETGLLLGEAVIGDVGEYIKYVTEFTSV